jgi:hypothetical protein
MSTTRKPRTVKPAHGSCRWILPLGTDVGILDINGIRYAVCKLAGGYRLMKPDGQTYDLDTSADPWTCTCADYEFNRHGKDPAGCKHCKGVRAGVAHLSKPVNIPEPKAKPEAPTDEADNGRALADEAHAQRQRAEERFRARGLDGQDVNLVDEPAAAA